MGIYIYIYIAYTQNIYNTILINYSVGVETRRNEINTEKQFVFAPKKS